MEIKLTQTSREKFNQLNHKAVRLYIKSACWSGVVLGVAPDEKRDNDEYVFVEGHMFVIEEGLYASIPKDITIDYVESGLMRGFNVYLN